MATPSGSARYWAGPGQGRRDGLRSPPPARPSPARSPAGGTGARGCQAGGPGVPALRPPQPPCLARPLSSSAAAAGTAAPLVSFAPLRRRRRRCLLLASATFGSPSAYASSAARIEASSPSCQIPHGTPEGQSSRKPHNKWNQTAPEQERKILAADLRNYHRFEMQLLYIVTRSRTAILEVFLLVALKSLEESFPSGFPMQFKHLILFFKAHHCLSP
ncbi:uncharacterized protein [Struthio camelus]|uniref:uncharacterized protein n=1 Tax=Struthio camelus TaxID=8801 RepID=UPI003603B43B